jgi:hypothetical protein
MQLKYAAQFVESFCKHSPFHRAVFPDRFHIIRVPPDPCGSKSLPKHIYNFAQRCTWIRLGMCSPVSTTAPIYKQQTQYCIICTCKDS